MSRCLIALVLSVFTLLYAGCTAVAPELSSRETPAGPVVPGVTLHFADEYVTGEENWPFFYRERGIDKLIDDTPASTQKSLPRRRIILDAMNNARNDIPLADSRNGYRSDYSGRSIAEFERLTVHGLGTVDGLLLPLVSGTPELFPSGASIWDLQFTGAMFSVRIGEHFHTCVFDFNVLRPAGPTIYVYDVVDDANGRRWVREFDLNLTEIRGGTAGE